MENVIDMAKEIFVLYRIVAARFSSKGGVVIMGDIVFVKSAIALKEAPPINSNIAQNTVSIILLQWYQYRIRSLFNVQWTPFLIRAQSWPHRIESLYKLNVNTKQL